MADNLYILDASSYVFRAYHAIGYLTNSKGFPTNAVFGFINMINKFISENNPDYFVAVFDSGGKSFRNDLFPDYKANRGDAPEDISLQFPKIIDYLQARGIKVLSMENYEADDIIGSISEKYKNKLNIKILSGDKDFTQLIGPSVSMIDTMKNKVMGPKEVFNKYGLNPNQMIDYFALVGDAIDNIPGVKGIGPKTALLLMEEFENLDNLYGSLDRIQKDRIRNLLSDFKDEAFLSKQLVTINTGLEVTSKINDFKITSPDEEKLNLIFTELEFDSFIKDEKKEDSLTKDANYHKVLTNQDFTNLLNLIKTMKEVSIDLETTSVNPIDAEIVGISMSFGENEAFYIPLAHSENTTQLQLKSVLFKLKSFLESKDIHKIGQNLKYEKLVFNRYEIDFQGIYFDTMIASHFLDSSLQSYSLDNLSRRFLDYKMISYKDLTLKGKKNIPFCDVPIDEATVYSCEDADITYRLYSLFKKKLIKEKLFDNFLNYEMPFVSVLSLMEQRGVNIDDSALTIISKEFNLLIKEIEQKIFNIIGEEFNINSTIQLREIIFDKLKLKPFKKTKKGEFSTDSESLQTMLEQHEVIQHILSFRFYSKLKSTYLDSLPELINKETKMLHTSYNHVGTSTGRLSSSNPNLQNIPIKTYEGKRIRESFVPRDDNYCLISADYSQIELRLLAHFAEDEVMINSYVNGEDIHSNTAAEIFGVPVDDVSEDQRRLAKTINFGIIYGIGPKRLSLQIGQDIKTSKEYIEKYFARYPRVKLFFDEMIEFAVRKGYVETLTKRRRYLKDIKSKNFILRSAGERAAINTPIQGSAADIIKIAMIHIHNDLKLNKYCRLIMQVHDELIFEVDKNKVSLVVKKIKEHMEKAVQLKVPLRVDIGEGSSWSEAH